MLDRVDRKWNAVLSQKYYLYPVHVSLSFLMTKGIESALYLLLLRLLHRDYARVMVLTESIATDAAFSTAGQMLFEALRFAQDDLHPDAHAVRLKVSRVTSLPRPLTRH